MRTWPRYLLAIAAVVAIAAYGEFILDVRGPHSQLRSEQALAAITSTSYADRDARLKEAVAKYGNRAQANDSVPGGTINGKWTITVDGNPVEEGPIIVKLAGMYGLFAVTSDDNIEGIFSFSIVPDSTTLSTTTSVKLLQDRFAELPARFVAFADSDMTIDSCAASPPSELGFGSIGAWLGMQAQTACVVHWNGPHPSSMLISVTLANGDPWMRPFARWICRWLTSANLRKLAASNHQPPTYGACVLVDRADRRRPRDAHDAFKSVVYEIRGNALARMN